MFSASSEGIGTLGKGMTIVLVEQVSGEKYRSTSLGPLSRHATVVNLPAGTYAVERVELPLGSLTYANWSDELGEYFGRMRIAANSRYFLGYFHGQMRVGFDDVLAVSVVDTVASATLLAKVANGGKGWNGDTTFFVGPAYEEEFFVY